MQEPPLHRHEKIRLNVLRETGLFNSGQETTYERFVAIASAVAETPIALMTLVDERRQWFKAKIGLTISETPRNVSFCGHAIQSEARAFVVADTLNDSRFRDNPLVIGDPRIRFYAGIPLRLSQDLLPIGTLCVIDKQPRQLSAEKIAALVALGEVLETVITTQLSLNRCLAAANAAPPKR
jgi:GAF domain-containing protein